MQRSVEGGIRVAFFRSCPPKENSSHLNRDPQAIESAKEIMDDRFTIIHALFPVCVRKLALRGVQSVHGVFMDIGVSSPQIDDASRGFSFRMDGPLDMRMDTSCGETAAQWLAKASEEEIARVIHTLGEERFAKRIARIIVQTRSQVPIETTQQLAQLVAQVVPAKQKGSHAKSSYKNLSGYTYSY